jgi:sugar-specific transcriptional regulator TrmB
MDKDILIESGLSNREADTYFELLAVEEALASEISEKTKESRTNTYDTLNSLIKKGLVSYVIKSNKKYFIATNPGKLLDWLDLKKDKLESDRNKIKELLPDLKKLRLPKEKKIEVEVYEGIEGLRTVYGETVEESRRTKKEFLIFGAIAGKVRELDPIYHKKHYVERKKYRIKARYIFIEGEAHPIAPYSQYKYLPKIYENFAATTVQGNQVAFWLLTKPEIVILIKSKKLADTYRNNFEVLWKVAKIKK